MTDKFSQRVEAASGSFLQQHLDYARTETPVWWHGKAKRRFKLPVTLKTVSPDLSLGWIELEDGQTIEVPTGMLSSRA